MSSKVRKPRHEMPKQAPDIRSKNFEEVALGYTEDLAVAEATRCIGCPKKPCVAGCPVGVDIPEFISLIAEGDFLGAARKILKNPKIYGEAPNNNIRNVLFFHCPPPSAHESISINLE
jgi:glutamate synthase (NADPH/NADH) small chain